MLLFSIVIVTTVAFVHSQCPFASNTPLKPSNGKTLIENYARSAESRETVNYQEVKADLKALMKESRDFWPADYGHYGPLLIRLAWHNAGSYRRSDGRGGADGGRQRFEPERSWPDNTNLDKARALLWDISVKYGPTLSWGDLFVLAGDAAIEDMGGYVLGFCGGRVDVQDGSESIQLGPSDIQEELFPCVSAGFENGECPEPLGSNTVGLQYVNPEGHLGNGDPVESANDIRNVFGRMNFDDEEIVAIIGGGHAFGKAHGACEKGPGASPNEDPFNPWPGLCGKGVANTVTSGFELPFTSKPTYWDNEYFKNLIDYEWEIFMGPGGHKQWRPVDDGTGVPMAVTADGSGSESIGLLTSDIALKSDPGFLAYVKMFSENMTYFDEEFSRAWYKLVTRDMGPRARCVNADAPPSQSWQFPLPQLEINEVPDYELVKVRIVELLDTYPRAYGQLTRLAWQCASTFRVTDYLGGCNGARIRFAPGKDWKVNKNLNQALDRLQPLKDEFSSLSWADLIVLAGTTAMDRATRAARATQGHELDFSFCGGRVDDTQANIDSTEDDAWSWLEPRISGRFNESVALLKDYIAVMGLSQRQFTAIVGAGYALGDARNCSGLFCLRTSFSSKPEPSTELTNIFFRDLLDHSFKETDTEDGGNTMYMSQIDVEGNVDILMYRTDMYFKTDPELSAIAMEFAKDQLLFHKELASAWTVLMNADMFDGPRGIRCNNQKETFTGLKQINKQSKGIDYISRFLEKIL